MHERESRHHWIPATFALAHVCCHTAALPFTLKKYLKAKEEL
jgi:hypothetical protein